jgi:integrase
MPPTRTVWWLENRDHKESEYVFTVLDKTPFTNQYEGERFTNRQHFMRRICKRVGVKDFGFHAIRHLTATILYRSGESVAVIQAVLRHKSPQTTTTYLHSLGIEETREALEKGLSARLGKVLEFPGKEKAPGNCASEGSVCPPGVSAAENGG